MAGFVIRLDHGILSYSLVSTSLKLILVVSAQNSSKFPFDWLIYAGKLAAACPLNSRHFNATESRIRFSSLVRTQTLKKILSVIIVSSD